MTGKITEIFSSIQGEGIYFGERQVFVRFAECNLSCSYCDTKFNIFREYEAEELFSSLESFGKGFHSVSFTGGEPLLQKDFLKESMRLVKQGGYRTYLETNGTLPEALEAVIDDTDIIAMDIKLPSSGSSSVGYWQEHRDFLKISADKDVFVKAVISLSTTKEDFVRMLDLLKTMNYSGILVLQPNSFDSADSLEEKLAIFKKYGENHPFPICAIAQMHKVLGVR